MLDKVYIDTGLSVVAQDVKPELKLQSESKRQQRTIVVHCKPNPRLPSKDWGLSNWARLTQHLCEAHYHVVQLGAATDPILPGAEPMLGLPPKDVPAVVSASSQVVCLVGFLMHVAAATATPAIVLYGGREHPAIDGYAGHIHLCSEPLDCRGRWGCHLAPDTDCTFGMKCMENINPQQVLDLVESCHTGQLETGKPICD